MSSADEDPQAIVSAEMQNPVLQGTAANNAIAQGSRDNILKRTADGSSKAQGKQIHQISENETVKDYYLQASFVRIGKWERVSQQPGDLVGKVCFRTKKMVWEFKENAIKRRIEIDWGIIMSLRAINEQRIWEIKLGASPKYFCFGNNSQPAKQPKWRRTEDFTNEADGREHYIKFEAATDEVYQQLVRSDARFFQMSQDDDAVYSDNIGFHRTMFADKFYTGYFGHDSPNEHSLDSIMGGKQEDL